jgi:hypothetical protein
MSNEPRITIDFLQTTDLPLIEESQIQIYVICEHICAYMLSFLPQVLHTIWC